MKTKLSNVSKGFTLIELVIVTVIIGILALIATPDTGGNSPDVNEVDYLIPLSINQSYITESSSVDELSYDSATDAIIAGADGLPEIVLFPTEDDAAGVFGLVKACGNEKNKDLRRQVLEGLNADEIECVNNKIQDGAVVTNITAVPGLRNNLKTAFESRVGDLVAFFVHSGVVGDGANTEYLFEGQGEGSVLVGRVMEVNLEGQPKNVTIQLEPLPIQTGFGELCDANLSSEQDLFVTLLLLNFIANQQGVPLEDVVQNFYNAGCDINAIVL